MPLQGTLQYVNPHYRNTRNTLLDYLIIDHILEGQAIQAPSQPNSFPYFYGSWEKFGQIISFPF